MLAPSDVQETNKRTAKYNTDLSSIIWTLHKAEECRTGNKKEKFGWATTLGSPDIDRGG